MTVKTQLTTALTRFQTALAADTATPASITELQEKLVGYSDELRRAEAQVKYREALAAANALGFENLAELEQRILNPGAPIIKKRIVKPVYRNPEVPSETWAGRGKPPRWLKAKLDAGAKVDDFRIAKAG
jgi:DNA-binding protein H-NS